MALRPASNLEKNDNDEDAFFSPELLYHNHSHSKKPTIERENSRDLLMALAKAEEPLSETQLSQITALDRHTIRSYAKQFLNSEMIEWDYVRKGNHTEKMHWLSSTGKAFALAIALEDVQLSVRRREVLITDIVNSYRPFSIRPVYEVGRKYIQFLLTKGYFDILYEWNTDTVLYLRNNRYPHFHALTWLSFLMRLNDRQLRKALRSINEFAQSLPAEENTILGTLVDQFSPIPITRQRKLLRTPSLKQIFKWHPELKAELGTLHLRADYETVRGQIVGIEMDPSLYHETAPLCFKSKGGGVYTVEKREPIA